MKKGTEFQEMIESRLFTHKGGISGGKRIIYVAFTSVYNIHMADHDSGSNLCQTCALCCNGVLHGNTLIDAEEQARLTNLGLIILPIESSLGFAQPCPLLVQKRCLIYAQRPNNCRNYECKLLRNFLNGNISFEEALSVVKQSHEMLHAIQDQLPEGFSIHEIRTILKRDNSSKDQWVESDFIDKPADPAIVLSFVMFSWHLNRYFLW